jgi:hypothetical protein
LLDDVQAVESSNLPTPPSADVGLAFAQAPPIAPLSGATASAPNTDADPVAIGTATFASSTALPPPNAPAIDEHRPPLIANPAPNEYESCSK